VDLVEEPGVGELRGDVAAADPPEVSPAAAIISSCRSATSAATIRTSASGWLGFGRSRELRIQQGLPA
jgi:hypothetical protein